VAVDDLTLEVRTGEVFGFLGPNGAGKTTTLKMLLGLVTPTSGAALLNGRSPGDPAARRAIGFLPEHFSFPPWLRAREFLTYQAALAGVPARDRARRVGRMLERVGLAGREVSPLSSFSKGMLQRIGLAQALLAEPRVVFLDEPTSGLDPLGRRLVRDVIRELRAGGVTVFLNSHLLGEVEAVCDRVAIVHRGRVVHTGPPRMLPGAGTEVEIEAHGLTPALLARMGKPFRSAEWSGDVIRLQLPEGEEVGPAIAQVVARLVGNGVAVYRVTPRQISLEEVFMSVVTDRGVGYGRASRRWPV
jgi:ABC-2 type transport system ATP-binding protein